MFHVVIAGGRDFTDYETLKAYVNYKLSNKKEAIEIVSGGCPTGADYLGERYAAEMGVSLCRFPADWQKYGRSAGVRRNKQMAEYADALIAFWAGKSRGTKNMIEEAKAAKIAVAIKRY